MDDEFKLCWKNFQDNIASGFQNLYDRGDLVDVTLACDGKLLQAHKIVLAICSPYFQEIFTTNPCKHPIIILKDVSFNIMLELLEFMYQGVVNVKHTELQSFMKIGQLLQIKGLATNPSSSAASTSSEKSSHLPSAIDDEHPLASKHAAAKAAATASGNANDSNPLEGNASSASKAAASSGAGGSVSPARSRSQCPSPVPAAAPPAPSSAANSPSPTPMSYVLNQHSLKSSPAGDAGGGNVTPLLNLYHSSGGGAGGSGSGGASSSSAGGNLKRHLDAFSNDALSIYSRKQFRRSLPLSEHNSSLSGDQQDHNTSDSNGGGPGGSSMGPLGEQVNHEDFFLPHISMVESRYDLNNLKREADHHSPVVAAAAAAAALRTFGPAFNFEYNPYKGSSTSAASGGNSGAGGGGLGGNGGGPPNSTGQEYPNELHMPNDYSKNFGNHMDIPQNGGNNVMMLSSTSLLHGNCVFNRNNTVATQQGMKTYWLCKSYRISMCRARCITHQGRVISATGVHNHAPHMRPGSGNAPGGGAPPTGVSHLATASATNASGLATQSATSIGNSSGNFVIEGPASMANGAGASGHLSNSLNPNVAMASSRLCQASAGSLSQMYHHQHGGANSHGHHQQQHQPPTPGHHHQSHHQQHDATTIAPPSPSSMTHSLPNLLIQHPQAASPSDLNMHGQHQHGGGGMASSMHHHHHMAMMASGHEQHHHSHQAGDSQHSPHLSHHHQPQQQQQQGHHAQHQAQLEITPLMQSSPPNGGAVHASLSPGQNSTRHGGSHSHNSPVGGAGAATTAAASDSPPSHATSMNEDNNNCSMSEHQILVHNAALDDDLSSPEMSASAAELTGDGADQHQQQQPQHPHQHHQQQQQAQVIDSITISPGSGHDFKMEDM